MRHAFRLDVQEIESRRSSTQAETAARIVAIWLVDMLYMKYVVDTYPCSGSERTLYQNFLALPILVVLLNTGFEKSSVLKQRTPHSAYVA